VTYGGCVVCRICNVCAGFAARNEVAVHVAIEVDRFEVLIGGYLSIMRVLNGIVERWEAEGGCVYLEYGPLGGCDSKESDLNSCHVSYLSRNDQDEHTFATGDNVCVTRQSQMSAGETLEGLDSSTTCIIFDRHNGPD